MINTTLVCCLFICHNYNNEFYGIIAIAISFSFGFLQIKLQNEKLFKELFTEFNKKYDEQFNAQLNMIESKCEKGSELDLDDKDKKIIIKYLNLCAEEYLWFTKGRIPQKVWNAWKAGMKYYAILPQIKKIIDSEGTQKDSYYGLFKEIEKWY